MIRINTLLPSGWDCSKQTVGNKSEQDASCGLFNIVKAEVRKHFADKDEPQNALKFGDLFSDLLKKGFV